MNAFIFSLVTGASRDYVLNMFESYGLLAAALVAQAAALLLVAIPVAIVASPIAALAAAADACVARLSPRMGSTLPLTLVRNFWRRPADHARPWSRYVVAPAAGTTAWACLDAGTVHLVPVAAMIAVYGFAAHGSRGALEVGRQVSRVLAVVLLAAVIVGLPWIATTSRVLGLPGMTIDEQICFLASGAVWIATALLLLARRRGPRSGALLAMLYGALAVLALRASPRPDLAPIANTMIVAGLVWWVESRRDAIRMETST